MTQESIDHAEEIQEEYEITKSSPGNTSSKSRNSQSSSSTEDCFQNEATTSKSTCPLDKLSYLASKSLPSTPTSANYFPIDTTSKSLTKLHNSSSSISNNVPYDPFFPSFTGPVLYSKIRQPETKFRRDTFAASMFNLTPTSIHNTSTELNRKFEQATIKEQQQNELKNNKQFRLDKNSSPVVNDDYCPMSEISTPDSVKIRNSGFPNDITNTTPATRKKNLQLKLSVVSEYKGEQTQENSDSTNSRNGGGEVRMRHLRTIGKTQNRHSCVIERHRIASLKRRHSFDDSVLAEFEPSHSVYNVYWSYSSESLLDI